ncbi:MAG: 1,4-dihydroxy-2-naphthoate polyprenyltransferase [Paludibacter sp.]|nr:1,4-dihydroxy-2-naphthoate polyprenyltransferase [Paludibacter sp.]MDD4198881.1 1,4-dihydroxy-2-naphthoate polyprenyltransferase [Paludibacter sp.]MDD4426779.1 1,4-dihydroxy-2-naphthoate polyprenyltransferase [Paludibacter sp.]
MLKYYIESSRPRTLPLALANTITGSALAYADGGFRWSVLLLAMVTTLLLQVLSNMANDYGDFRNGKDTSERIGPRRMVQAGKISPRAMLRAIAIVVFLILISGTWLIIEGFSNFKLQTAIPGMIVFGVLGLTAIVAAIKYTVGKNPYGYKAMGDLFVFIFFGLIGVLGTYFLHTGQLYGLLVLPSVAIGFLSVGVLNLNNLRDYESDKKTGKRTLVVVLGLRNARYYHLILLMGAVVLVSLYTLLDSHCGWQWMFWLAFPLIFKNMKAVASFSDHKQLFPELKRLSMASLLFALLFAAGLLICT